MVENWQRNNQHQHEVYGKTPITGGEISHQGSKQKSNTVWTFYHLHSIACLVSRVMVSGSRRHDRYGRDGRNVQQKNDSSSSNCFLVLRQTVV